MTRDDVIRMAREAGFLPEANPVMPQLLERFAALVAAAEREACVMVCEEFYSIEGIAQDCAAAIRARGEQ